VSDRSRSLDSSSSSPPPDCRSSGEKKIEKAPDTASAEQIAVLLQGRSNVRVALAGTELTLAGAGDGAALDWAFAP